jgi:hypothetical protein
MIAIGVPKVIASQRFCRCTKKPNKILDDLDAINPYFDIDGQFHCIAFLAKYKTRIGFKGMSPALSITG